MAKQQGRSVGLFMCFCAMVAAQNLVVPVASEASFEENKNYYTPDPNIGTPPAVPRVSPPHRTSPPHGQGSTPPYHLTPTPPTQNCGNPPHVPTPSTPRRGGGGGGSRSYYNPPPSTPSGGSGGGSYYNPPPSTPSGGGRSYYNPPPSTPSGGGGGSYSNPPASGGTPPTPVIVSPPTTPIIIPGTPALPPFLRLHSIRTQIPSLGHARWWGTVGGTFGATSMPGFPSNLNLMQALSNTRTDGLGQLYREGTASLLNSMVNARFPLHHPAESCDGCEAEKLKLKPAAKAVKTSAKAMPGKKAVEKVAAAKVKKKPVKKPKSVKLLVKKAKKGVGVV
ncbi:protodermal factor 1-like [Eucalyptus grandis]|uniref:protodermal factor 1-like n=1 Tax=Eucalyptus grandis TaxID=71139 RepID=UPI00192EA58C|nr:protodermal factor 1-like [Eucalyptus grandis]